MTTYQAIVLGEIWWPMGVLCSLERTIVADSDAAAIDDAQNHSGDFSKVTDVLVSTGACQHEFRIVKEWNNEDNEMAYYDTVSEDE